MNSAEYVPVATSVPADEGFFRHHGLWAPGGRAFRKLRFNTKAALISLVFLAPMLALVSWLLHSQYERTMQERMNATRQHVEIAYGLLQYAHGMEAAGKLTREAAQTLAISLLEPLRYEQGEYFWINDVRQRMVMHPVNPQLNGRDMSGYTDPRGEHVFRRFAETGSGGGQGFVSYQWAKPNHPDAEDKISYVRGFEPWGWVLGSGVYVHDVWENVRSLIAWTAFWVLLTVAVGAYLFLSFYHVMNGGLKETRRHLHAMATGDLTTSPSPWGKDEAAELMLDLLAMQNALRTMVVHVRESSDEILYSAREIAAGANDLSSRTEHAAGDLEASAAAMEEITSTISHNTQHTGAAARMALQNAQVATDGGRVMREVVGTMEQIRDSSNKIAEIAGTIDGIAFQTNILALNAAVESARAGEQGRGFAVVAAEVRALALRTAAAAKEVSKLISESVSKVASGVSVVTEAGTMINDIEQSSQQVNRLLGEIANGAREQDIGVRQISQAVNELDRMTQQNAALVEQTAAAAMSMERQAAQLAGEVARFLLPDHAQAVAR